MPETRPAISRSTLTFSNYLGVALVAAPFFIKAAPYSDTSLSQALFLHLLSFAGVILFGIKKTSIQVKVMALATLIAVFVAYDPYQPFQYYQLGSVISGIIFVAVISSNIDYKHISLIYKLLSAACLLSSAWVFLNYFGFDPYTLILNKKIPTGSFSLSRPPGSLGNPIHSGAFIACTLVFVRPYLWIFPVLALYLLGSALPVIGAFTAVSVYYCYKKNKLRLLVFPISILVILAASLLLGYFGSDSFFFGTDRVQAWKHLISIMGFDFNGNGFGYVTTVFSESFKGSQPFIQMHNEWLEAYAILGLLGVLICSWLVLPIFKDKGHPAINACLISLFINSLGNFTFHIAPLFMVFGACYAIQLQGEKNATSTIGV
jgi:hypothetical protein